MKRCAGRKIDKRKEDYMSENKSALTELIEHGKQNGKLTTKEITDALESCDYDAEQIDKLYDDFEANNIDIIDDFTVDEDLDNALDFAGDDDLDLALSTDQSILSPTDIIRIPLSRKSSSSTRPLLLRLENLEKSFTISMSYSRFIILRRSI